MAVMAQISRHVYKSTGVVVQEIDEGQPCEKCADLCKGFSPHPWRKTCSSCKCPRNTHDVYHEEWVNACRRLGFTFDTDDREPSRERSLKEGFSWVPPGLPSNKIEEYFKALPPEKVPRLGSSGEKYRDKAVIEQLPKQDLHIAYCKFVEPSQHNSYEDFVSARNEIALDIAYVKNYNAGSKCPTCSDLVRAGDLAVLAPKFGEDVAWHPACFVCQECKQLLVDLAYCVQEDNIYCERHYAELLKPRCAGCDEVRLY